MREYSEDFEKFKQDYWAGGERKIYKRIFTDGELYESWRIQDFEIYSDFGAIMYDYYGLGNHLELASSYTE